MQVHMRLRKKATVADASGSDLLPLTPVPELASGEPAEPVGGTRLERIRYPAAPPLSTSLSPPLLIKLSPPLSTSRMRSSILILPFTARFTLTHSSYACACLPFNIPTLI